MSDHPVSRSCAGEAPARANYYRLLVDPRKLGQRRAVVGMDRRLQTDIVL
jgi:hypothetical protein